MLYNGAISTEFTTIYFLIDVCWFNPNRRGAGQFNAFPGSRTTSSRALADYKNPYFTPIVSISINQHTWGVTHLTVARALFLQKGLKASEATGGQRHTVWEKVMKLGFFFPSPIRL